MIRTALIALLVTLALPATALAQLGDPTRLSLGRTPASFDDVTSSADGRTTFLVDDRTVLYADADGDWHRFTVPSAIAIQLIGLEGGSGMAVWGAGTTIYGRRWHADGRLEAPTALLNGVLTDESFGSPPRMGWRLTADRAGNVVLTAQGDAAHRRAIYAAARIPGGPFSPQQELVPPALAPSSPRLSLHMLPMAPDGTATVSWFGEWNDPLSIYRTGVATRRPGATQFEPATIGEAPRLLTGVATDGGGAVPIAFDVNAACDGYCDQSAKLFTWPNGEQRLALHGLESSPVWWIARRGPDGRFTQPRVATRTGGLPIWTQRPGVIAFVKAVGGGVYAVPYGERPRRAPRMTVGAVRRTLEIPVSCSTACSVQAMVRSGRRTFRARSDTMEPLETAVVAPALPTRVTRVNVTLTARGVRGTTRTRFELHRVKGSWVRR
jgi:hypothetical protein